MPSWKIYVPVALVVLGVSYAIGYRNEVAATKGAGSPPLTFRSAVRHALADRSQKDAFSRLDELRHRAGRTSPTPLESAECWSIIRNFSEKQLRDYLEELPAEDGGNANYLLKTMLFHRWAQLAPEAAAAELAKNKELIDAYVGRSVLCAWLPRDRDAARRWVDATGTPSVRHMYNLLTARMLVNEDPATALDRAGKEDPGAIGAVLNALAKRMAGTEESRKEFLALEAKYGGMKEWKGILSTLSLAAGEQGAAELLADLHRSDEVGGISKDYRDKVIERLSRQRPEGLLDWTLQPSSGVSQEKQYSIYRTWSANNPQQAAEWAARNGRTEFIGKTAREAALIMMRSGWQYGSKAGALETAPARYASWKAQDSAAAEAWLGGMPSDIRKFLTEPAPDATH